MPTTTNLTVTVRCGHCDHVLATYAIEPADRPRTEAKYKWQHLTCSFCHKTMGPKITITDTPLADPLPAVPPATSVPGLRVIDASGAVLLDAPPGSILRVESDKDDVAATLRPEVNVVANPLTPAGS